jgi:hypothetical protein
MQYAAGFPEGNDRPSQMCREELSRIAAAIGTCRTVTGADVAEIRSMIRFFNQQLLATGYSDLN